MRKINPINIVVFLILVYLSNDLLAPFLNLFSDKKPTVDYHHFYDEGVSRLGLSKNNDRFVFSDKDSLVFHRDTSRYPLDALERFFEQAVKGSGSAEELLSPLFALFIHQSTPEYSGYNARMMEMTLLQLDRVYRKKDIEVFVRDMNRDLLDSGRLWLVQPLWLAEVQRRANHWEYDKALELARPLVVDWSGYEPFDRCYAELLWQNGQFMELRGFLKTLPESGETARLYGNKVEKLTQAAPTYALAPLTLLDNGLGIILSILILLIFIWTLKEVIDYFRIFLFYRKDLMARMLNRTQSDDSNLKNEFYCPVCGRMDSIEHKQPFHHTFKVCEDDDEILIPKNCCPNCGTVFDKYLNCPACGFNQKGELAYVFGFDLISTFLFALFSLSSLLLFGKHYLPEYGFYTLEQLKIFNQTVLIFGTSVSLTPFLLKDFNWESLSMLYRFDRFFFVSIDKFLAYIFVYFLLVGFTSNSFLFHQTLFYTPLNFAFSLLYAYGLLKFFQFGQNHRQYYERKIKATFITGISLTGWVIFAGLLPLLPQIVRSYTGLLEQTDNIYFLNGLAFFIITQTIWLQTRRENKGKFDGLITFAHNFGELIISLAGTILIFTILVLFYWFFTRQYTYLNLLFAQLIGLASYWFIVAKHEKKSSQMGSRLAINHNVYILIYVTLIFLVGMMSVFSTFYSYTDLVQFSGIWHAAGYVIGEQISAFLNFSSMQTSPFFLPFMIAIIISGSFALLVVRQIKSQYHVIFPKKTVNIFEAQRVNLLVEHFGQLSSQFGKIRQHLSDKRRENLKTLLYEERYLLETYSTRESKTDMSRRLNDLIKRLERNDDITPLEYQKYKRELESFRDGHHVTFVQPKADDPWYNQIEEPLFRPVLLWEKKLYDSFVKRRGRDFMHITEHIWTNSLRLYARALKRFLLQSTRFQEKKEYLHDKTLSDKIFKISDQDYFLLIFSDRNIFPPSVQKLIAMKWHNKKPNDFIYIYFCDNYPQVKTGNYLTEEANRDILNEINSTDPLLSVEGVNELREFYNQFLKEVRGYGYRCEFFPVDATIFIEDGRRTKFSDREDGPDYVPVHKEYYPAKFALVVEKGNFKMEYEKLMQARYQSDLSISEPDSPSTAIN